MKRLCILLAALLMLTVPAIAEDAGAEMAQLLLGDWVHGESSDYYLLFDGVDKYYYEADGDFYYGSYAYEDGVYRLVSDEGDERVLTMYDDMSLELEGIEGYFYCSYRYWLMSFPATDEGTWLNDDGVTTLLFDLYGGFELDTESSYYFGEYAYQGNGDFLLNDDEGNSRVVSCYDDGSISLEGIDGYFWLQADVTGDDPFGDGEPAMYMSSPALTRMTYMGGEEFAEGMYESYLSEDGLIAVEVMALETTEFGMVGEGSVDEFIQLYADGEIYNIADIACDSVCAYPAQRIRFETGAEEDAVVVDVTVIWTESETFIYVVNVSADAWYGFMDGYAEGDIQTMVDTWVMELQILEY